MDKKLYLRGRIATPWYNFCELLAYALTYRPTPKSLIYEKRIKYGAEKKQYYNTYCRKDLVGTEKPLFVYVHGGGFISGITDMRNTYIQNFAKRGFFTASISYSYAPVKIYPTPLQGVCDAMDNILDKAKEKKYDPHNVVLCGESAGVYYIFMLAAIAADPTLADKIGVKFRHKDDIKIKAMVSHSGCYDLKKILDPAFPQSKYPDIKMMACSFVGKRYDDAVAFLNTPEGTLSYPHINASYPPTFFATGAKDHLRHESYDAMELYKQYDIPYAHYEGTGNLSAHAWTIVTVLKKGKECLEETFKFLEKYFPEIK